MKSQKSDTKDQIQEKSQKAKQQEARIKYFIQTLDIKRDTNMTRIYSALQSIKNH